MVTLHYKTFIGDQIRPHIEEIAAAGIEGFRSYPYLYVGSLDYERSYLEGYCQDPHALLICVLNNNKIAALATSLPLSSNSHIVAGGPSLFRTHGEDPLAFYYYAEIIVRPLYRRAGIAKEIYRLRKNHANSLGLRSLCLAVVERAKNHPLCPADHIISEPIWMRDGFSPTDMTFVYNWPTIQANGTVADQENVMRFWTKKHRTD